MIRLSRLSSLVLCAILLLLPLVVNPVLGQGNKLEPGQASQEPQTSPARPRPGPVEVNPAAIDTSSLSLPAVEIRSVVPYGKEDARFGKVTVPPEDIRFMPSTPIQVRLLASKAPRLNEAINVSLEIYAARDAPGTAAQLELPEGVKLLSGSPAAQLDLAAEQRAEVKASIVFTRPGEYTIVGRALKTVDAETVWGDMDALFLTVGQDAGFVGFESGKQSLLSAGQASPDLLSPQQIYVGEEAPGAPEALEEPQDPAPESVAEGLFVPERAAFPPEAQESPDSASPAVLVDISICWIMGSDRDGTSPPLRDAQIELWDADTGSGNDLLATSYTGYTSGCTTFTVDNTDADECCTIDVYIVVVFYHAGRYRVTTYGGGLFGGSTGTQYNISSDFNFGTWWIGGGSGNDRSVRIYNDLWRSRHSVYARAVAAGLGGLPGEVWVLWETGGADGTYYSLGDGKVHLADNDAASRDTAVHESQHSYMDDIYSTWPPWDCPSPHYIQYVSGCGCAWSEGWTYVTVSLADCNPVFTWPSGATLNLETPMCTTANWDDGPQVEGRVGGVLIDLMDPVWCPFGPYAGAVGENYSGCGDDRFGDSYDAVWDLIYDQDDQVFVSCGGYTNSFSNAWESRAYPRQAPDRIGDLNTVSTFTHD